MKNILSFALAACAIGAVSVASAAEKDNPFYAGVTVGTAGQLVHFANGVRVESNRPTPFRLYGGYEVNQYFAIEAGYTHFGGFKFPNGIASDVGSLHLAAKGSMALGENFTLYGKVGVSNVAITRKSSATTFKAHDLRTLLAVGASYRLTEAVAVTLDVTDYGSLKKPGVKLTPRTIEVGLRYQW